MPTGSTGQKHGASLWKDMSDSQLTLLQYTHHPGQSKTCHSQPQPRTQQASQGRKQPCKHLQPNHHNHCNTLSCPQQCPAGRKKSKSRMNSRKKGWPCHPQVRPKRAKVERDHPCSQSASQCSSRNPPQPFKGFRLDVTPQRVYSLAVILNTLLVLKRLISSAFVDQLSTSGHFALID